ncbi:hypothetical protein M3Y97_00907500 [Aphelenchoides bicaudatus]|nr:hypothetical protein M3Y97_00907500 [Aphelenchoides bicaudatus]
MADDASNDAVIDSWEDLLEGDTDAAFEKLNEAIEKVQISGKNKKEVDPFSSSKSSRTTKADDNRLDGFRHLAVLKGTPIDVQDVTQRLKKEFENIRIRQINDSNLIIVFGNVIDACRAVSSNQKFLPLKLCAIDDPDFRHLDYVFENADLLRSSTSDVRPATNMSVIRNIVSRQLNVKLSSEKQQEDKQKLQKAREAKKAKEDMWK